MPRNGSGVYSLPASTKGAPNEIIRSLNYNTFLDDLVADLNANRFGFMVHSGNATYKTTKALLEADLTPDDGAVGIVHRDGAPGNNGVYTKSGGPGVGSWSQVLNFLPGYQFAVATNAGTGTANAIVATSEPFINYVDGVQLISLNITATNTSETVTVAFDGGSALTVKTNADNPPAIGGLVAGMKVLGEIQSSGTEFRIISDQTSAAIQAAVEATANHAADLVQNVDTSLSRNVGRIAVPWDAVTEFTIYQSVEHEGLFYYAKQTNIGQEPAPGGTAFWEEMGFFHGGRFLNKARFITPTVDAASVNFPSGGPPAAPEEGDVWFANGALYVYAFGFVQEQVQRLNTATWPTDLALVKRVATETAWFSVPAASVLPWTNPAVTDGTLVTSGVYTPRGASGQLTVQAQGQLHVENDANIALALYADSVCIALALVRIAGGGGGAQTFSLTPPIAYTPGSQNPITFSLRAGHSFNPGFVDIFFNGNASGGVPANLSATTITVFEGAFTP